MREHYRIKDNDFLTFDAIRQAAQCMVDWILIERLTIYSIQTFTCAN